MVEIRANKFMIPTMQITNKTKQLEGLIKSIFSFLYLYISHLS